MDPMWIRLMAFLGPDIVCDDTRLEPGKGSPWVGACRHPSASVPDGRTVRKADINQCAQWVAGGTSAGGWLPRSDQSTCDA